MVDSAAYRSFECSNRDEQNLNSLVLSKCYVQFNEPQCIFGNREEIIDNSKLYTLLGFKLDQAIWDELSDFKELMELINIKSSAYKDDLMHNWEITQWTQEFLLAYRNFMLSNHSKIHQESLQIKFEELCSYIQPIQDLSDSVLNYSNDDELNNINVHMSLNMMWLKLTTQNSDKLNTIESNLQEILQGLIKVALKKFNSNAENSLDITPFHCACFKELWFLVQRYCEIINKNKKTEQFWYFFNAALQDELNLPLVEKRLQPVVKKRKTVENKNACAKECMGIIWLTLHVSKLLQFDENGEYQEELLCRNIPNYYIAEEAMRKFCIASNCSEWLTPTLHLLNHFDQVWQPLSHFPHHRVIILKILSEYFCKNFPTMSTTIKIDNNQNYVLLTKEIVENKSKVYCDFDIYVHMIGLFLTKSKSLWPSMKGSLIFKLFHPNFNSLPIAGFHNYFKLIFTLCWTMKNVELTERLQNIVDNRLENCQQYNGLVWSAKISYLHLRALDGQICVVSDKFKESLNAVIVARDVKKINQLVSVMQLCFYHDSDLRLQTHLLFGNWILNYIQWTNTKELKELLKMMDDILQKLSLQDVGTEWELIVDKYFTEIIDFLSKKNGEFENAGQIANKIIKFRPPKFDTLLTIFLQSDKELSFIYSFLKHLLQNDNIFSDKQEKQILRTFFRFSILHKDKNEIKDLTIYLKKLRNFNNLKIKSDAPFEDFINYIQQKINNKYNLELLKKEICEYLDDIANWCDINLKLVENNLDKNIHISIYKILSLLFLRCSPVLYNSNKSHDCLLVQLSNVLLLRPTVIRPKTQQTLNKNLNETLLKEIRKNWIFFARGVLRINVTGNMEMLRIWKEMLEQFVPDLGSSIFDLVQNEFPDNECEMIIKYIVMHFFSRKNHPRTDSVLEIFQEMIKISTTKFPILFKHIFPHLCVHIKWKSNGETRSKIILGLISNKKEFKTVTENAKFFVVNFFKEGLAFESAETFRTFKILAKYFQNEIAACLNEMENFLPEVEIKRNQPFDDSLRRSFEELKSLVLKKNS